MSLTKLSGLPCPPFPNSSLNLPFSLEDINSYYWDMDLLSRVRDIDMAGLFLGQRVAPLLDLDSCLLSS